MSETEKNERTMKNIEINTLIKYAFQELSAEKEAAVEEHLASNPTDFAKVDGILNFALKNNITSAKKYLKAVEQHRSETIAVLNERSKAETTDTAASSSNNRKKDGRLSPKRVLYLLGIILLTAIGALWINGIFNSETDIKPNSLPNVPQTDVQNALDEFMLQNQKTVTAGRDTDDWKANLREGKPLIAREQLSEIIADIPSTEYLQHTDKFYYAGVLHLLTEGGDYKRALEYLETARGTRRQEKFSVYVLVFLANNDFVSAKKEFDKNPEFNGFYSSDLKQMFSPY